MPSKRSASCSLRPCEVLMLLRLIPLSANRDTSSANEIMCSSLSASVSSVVDASRVAAAGVVVGVAVGVGVGVSATVDDGDALFRGVVIGGRSRSPNEAARRRGSTTLAAISSHSRASTFGPAFSSVISLVGAAVVACCNLLLRGSTGWYSETSTSTWSPASP